MKKFKLVVFVALTTLLVLAAASAALADYEWPI